MPGPAISVAVVEDPVDRDGRFRQSFPGHNSFNERVGVGAFCQFNQLGPEELL